MSRSELARQAATDAAAKYRDSGMSMRNLADEIVDAYLAALEGAQPVADAKAFRRASEALSQLEKPEGDRA